MKGVFNQGISRERLLLIYLPNLLAVMIFNSTDVGIGISPRVSDLIALYAGMLVFSFAFCVIAYGFVNVLMRSPV